MKQTIELKEDLYSTRAENADVRIMTANLESEEWGGGECLPRAEIFYANLMYYSPDVIGVQEISVSWAQALRVTLEPTDYAVLHEVVEGTDSNYCPLLYNTKTLAVVKSGAYRLSIGGPAKARTVTWAVFSQLETGKQFAVLNTHLDWTQTPNDFESHSPTTPYSREQQVREIAQTYKQILEEYPSIEIFMTADWNTMKGQHPLNVLQELTELEYAEDIVPNNDWGNEVDHIFVPGITKVLAIHLYRENATDLGASDHPWGYADIELQSNERKNSQ